MKRKLMIKILEYLEEAYPRPCLVEKLRSRLKLRSLGGEFYKVIKYLKATNKIIVHLPETRLAPTQREELIPLDEITITPEGINLLIELNKVEIDKKRNYLLLDTTIVITQIAIIGLALTIYEKFKLNQLDPSINIPWFLSALIWFVFICFSALLILKIPQIIFNKESWRGIFFDRE